MPAWTHSPPTLLLRLLAVLLLPLRTPLSLCVVAMRSSTPLATTTH
jgi:hypothetical protein